MKNTREAIKSMRRDFNFGNLNEEEILANPIDMLKNWLDTAIANKIIDANAFVLSTCVDNKPTSRVLLIRGIYEEGIHFYTNYNSLKANELDKNPNTSINLFWPQLDRQIRIKARASRLDTKVSDEYFKTRPRGSQIGAWASNQSAPIANRDVLEERVKEVEKRFEGQDIPRPDFWGGYLLEPFYFEFWQGRKNRLHDRISYEKIETAWRIERLFP